MPFHFCGVELMQLILAIGVVRHWISVYKLWRSGRNRWPNVWTRRGWRR